MQKLGRKLAFQWFATVAVGLAAFALQTVLARELGPRGFGLYSVALSFGGIMYVIQNAGFRALFLREDVKASEGFAPSGQIFSLALAHTLLITLMIIVAVFVWGQFSPSELIVPAALILAINAPRIMANLVSAGLIAKNNFETEAKWQMLSRLLPYGAATLAALAGGSLTVILMVSVLVTSAVLWVRPIRHPALVPAWLPDMTVYKAAIGLGLLDLVTQFYVRISTLVLYEVAVPFDAIGQYGVFQRLLEATTMVLGPLAFMFHNLVRAHGFDAAVTRRFGWRVMAGLAGLNLLAFPIQHFYGADILEFVFGAGYRDTAHLLNWLQIAVILMAPNMMMGQALIALNQEWLYVRFGLVIACVSLLANMLLAPRLGIHGAVQATVISELVLFGLMASRLFVFRPSAPQRPSSQ